MSCRIVDMTNASAAPTSPNSVLEKKKNLYPLSLNTVGLMFFPAHNVQVSSGEFGLGRPKFVMMLKRA